MKKIKYSMWIVTAGVIITLLFFILTTNQTDLMAHFLNSDISFMSITFVEGYNKTGSKSSLNDSDIDFFMNYMGTLSLKEVKKNDLYEDLHSHIGLGFFTEGDRDDKSSDAYLMEIINDEFIYISTRLDNKNVRTSKTYTVLDGTIDRNKLYQLFDLMQDDNA